MNTFECLRLFGDLFVCGRPLLVWVTLLLLLIGGTSVQGQSDEEMMRLFQSIEWQTGPCTARLGSVAEIDVPQGFQFTGPQGARKWAEATGNIPDNACLGVLVPENGGWFTTFDFNEIGYVKDDEKDQLDADVILEAVKQATAEANKTRRNRGWHEVHIVGWESTPSYDEATNNLVWAIRGRSENRDVVNYNTRLLGRGGVMSVTLVDGAETFGRTVPTVKGLITGFRYKKGQRYAEWRVGDKVATYGLTGLIAGGGTVAAVKTGLLAKLGALLAKGGKVIVVAIIAFFAWLNRKRFVGGKSN